MRAVIDPIAKSLTVFTNHEGERAVSTQYGRYAGEPTIERNADGHPISFEFRNVSDFTFNLPPEGGEQDSGSKHREIGQGSSGDNGGDRAARTSGS